MGKEVKLEKYRQPQIVSLLICLWGWVSLVALSNHLGDLGSNCSERTSLNS